MDKMMAGRDPIADFNTWVDSQVDNYKNRIEQNVINIHESCWIAHPVQKEAIQNSADAFLKKSQDDWKVTFEIDPKIPPKYFSITDQGTTGLTGRSILSKETLDNLQKNKPEKYQSERWAKFEALSYPNINPVGRGSRGQGKWMFIGASKTKEIFYDSLRSDKVYRVGAWLGEQRLLQNPPEGEKAKKFLTDNFPTIKPLKKIGTRVIIKNPKNELGNGFFPFIGSPIGQYIGETWWELIKAGKKITTKWMDKENIITCPEVYTESYIKKEAKEIWKIEDVNLKWKKNEDVRVKEFVCVYSKQKIPSEYCGISIQRSGMKICSYDILRGNPQIPQEMSEHLYGWIIFNEEGEKEQRAIEDPTHYDYRASVGSFGYHVFGRNGWISDELKKFGEKKLGIGSEKRKREDLDILVANRLNRFFRKFYSGVRLQYPVSPPTVGPITRKRKKIRIKMTKPTFPKEHTRRIEFGETLSNIQFSIVNDTKSPVKLKVSLVLKTTSNVIGERVLKKFKIKEICVVNGTSESPRYGSFSILFDETKYASGKYIIETEIVLLESEFKEDQYIKGAILDQEREIIYLDIDPPSGKGLFEHIYRVEFKENKDLQYRTLEKDKKMRIEINILHPAYKYRENLDDFMDKNKLFKKFKGNRSLFDYELSIGAEILSHYDIRNEAALISNRKKDFLLNRKEDKNAFFIEAIDQSSKIAQKIRNEILK